MHGILAASLEDGIFECVFVVFLACLVEVVHVELSGIGVTCLTKEV